MQIREKVAIVTGAGAGIGRAAALKLAREGAAVVAADLDEGEGRDAAREAQAEGGQAAFFRVDVASEADVAAMVAFAEETYGGLDILVNNAGGATPPYFPDADPSHWERTIDVNLRGVMFGIQCGLRAMRKRGGGAIVNISSVGGIGFRPYDLPEYGAAKAGVVRLTAALGGLHKSDSVRVNCICPGWVDTPASRRSRAALTPAERERLPAVILQPTEIAEAVVMFVQDETMAGRVMIWEEGAPWRFVPLDASP